MNPENILWSIAYFNLRENIASWEGSGIHFRARNGKHEDCANPTTRNSWGGLNIMVWSGIGLNLKLRLVIFQNIDLGRDNGLTAACYIDQIRRPHVVPFFANGGHTRYWLSFIISSNSVMYCWQKYQIIHLRNLFWNLLAMSFQYLLLKLLSFKIKLFNTSVLHFCSVIGQGCGNTEMFYLSPGKLSEKSYLSGQNPTCPVFFGQNIWYLQTQLLNWTLSITSLHKILNIVLIKLTQTSLSKWSLPKWRPF